MKLVTFSERRKRGHPKVIHAADIGLAPLCGQENPSSSPNTQEEMIGEVTCKRCSAMLEAIQIKK